MTIRRRTILIAAGIGLLFLVGWGIQFLMYLPQKHDNIDPIQEMGLYRNLQIERGECTFEVPPSVRSFVQPFLRSVQSWYGYIVLSDEATDELLHNYCWEKWTISEEEWESGTKDGHLIDYADSFMLQFDFLKKAIMNKQFMVCHDFDQEQDQTHKIGHLFSFFAPDARTIFFYYTSS